VVSRSSRPSVPYDFTVGGAEARRGRSKRCNEVRWRIKVTSKGEEQRVTS
jgi:hypothetical protein